MLRVQGQTPSSRIRLPKAPLVLQVSRLPAALKRRRTNFRGHNVSVPCNCNCSLLVVLVNVMFAHSSGLTLTSSERSISTANMKPMPGFWSSEESRCQGRQLDRVFKFLYFYYYLHSQHAGCSPDVILFCLL